MACQKTFISFVKEKQSRGQHVPCSGRPRAPPWTMAEARRTRYPPNRLEQPAVSALENNPEIQTCILSFSKTFLSKDLILLYIFQPI